MSRIFWTADTHFGHANIIVYTHRTQFLNKEELKLYKNPRGERWRPSVKSTSRMDAYLIDQINAVVGEDDILWHLGDFCFGPKNEEKFLARAWDYRHRIKCKNVNFVRGNHDPEALIDRVFERRVEDHKGNPILDHRGNEQYEGAYAAKEIKWKGQHVSMYHYAGAVWNKSHRGGWMLYGHSHTTAESFLDKVMPGRRSFDIGVDNAKLLLGEYRPFSLEEIREIMKKREGASIDHHGEKIKDFREKQRKDGVGRSNNR